MSLTFQDIRFLLITVCALHCKLLFRMIIEITSCTSCYKITLVKLDSFSTVEPDGKLNAILSD